MDALAIAILILGIVGGLVLVPLGLPGLWVMVGANPFVSLSSQGII